MTDQTTGQAPEADPTAKPKGKSKKAAATPAATAESTAAPRAESTEQPDDSMLRVGDARRVAEKAPSEAIDPVAHPLHAMAQRIWDSQPKVQISVPRVKGQNAAKLVILAEINGVQWHGIPGKTHVVPAEVARIAVQGGVAFGELHPDFADELSYEGPVIQIAEHSDPRFVDPDKNAAGR